MSKCFDLESEEKKARKWVIMKTTGVERENALEMLQSSVLLCWLLACLVEIGKCLHTLKYPKGQLSCVILLLEVYIFPLSVEIIFCTLHRVT